MLFVDRSVENFIAHPENYHLVNQGGAIKAVLGRSNTQKEIKVHQAALNALNNLSSPIQITGGLIANSIFDPLNLVAECKKAEFIYKINKWALAAEDGENRQEAARLIIEAYTQHKTQLNLDNLNLTSLPSEISQLTNLIELTISHNPIVNNITEQKLIAQYPFLLTIRGATQFLDNPQALLEICQLNGLALAFIPHHKQTKELVAVAIKQNLASIAFVSARLAHVITNVLANYPLAKQAVAINPQFARFVPDHVIDIATVLKDIKAEPYLITLLAKVGAFDQITHAMYKQAIAYDGKLISCLPANIQASDFGHDLISLALEQTPLAYYGIDPVFFNQDLFTLMMARHKDHPDLEPVLKDIISLMDTQDTALRDRMLNLAYPLSQYFHHDKNIILMLISKYGISLQDVSDDLKADYDIVRAAIHHDPGEITYSKVTDPGQQRLLQQYAQERRRQL